MKNAASKSAWGRESTKTVQELDAEAKAFFGELKVPAGWKFLKYDRSQYGTEIYSIGAVFLDTRTKGFDVKRYRVFICSTSGKGGICEIAMGGARGGYSLNCLICNKAADQLNDFIKQQYEQV